MITEKVKLSFGKSAAGYDAHGTLQREVSSTLVKSLASSGIEAPKRMLDIGCGTGFASLEALRLWPGSSIAALDIAREMAVESRKAGISRSIAADASFLPFQKDSFDLAISSLALQWVPEIKKVFSETARVLKTGGAFAFSTMGPGTMRELQRAYNKACMECTGKPARFPKSIDAKELAERLASSGFNNVASESVPIVKTYSDVESLFKTLKGVGATLPGRPANLPRRDVLAKTKEYYVQEEQTVKATYEIIFMNGTKR